MTFQDTVSFEQLNEAWTYLTQEKDWYKLYEPLGVKPTEYFASGVLGPYIIRLANLIRYDLKNRWGDYSAIRRWEISFDLSSVSREEMMQFCPHCYRQVTFLPRYPAYLCENCLILLTDEKGRKVTYHQVSAAGGCQGFFRDTNEMYDSTVCFIQGDTFVAEEGKYGGIFVQPDFVH